MKSEYLWPVTAYRFKLLNLSVRTRSARFNPSVLWFTRVDQNPFHATDRGVPPRLEFELQHQSSMPILMAARSNSWVCGRSITGIAGSNPAGSIGVCFFVSFVCFQVEVSAPGRLLVQRNLTECGVFDCNREA
jgi:hypothetical protein